MRGYHDRDSGSLLDRAWQAVIALVVLALGAQLAASLLLKSLGVLLVLGGLVSVLWLAWRARAGRRPWGGSPWP